MSKHDSPQDSNVRLDVGGWISGPCLTDLDAIREFEQRTRGDQRLRPLPAASTVGNPPS